MLSAVLVSPFALLKSDLSRLTERLSDKRADAEYSSGLPHTALALFIFCISEPACLHLLETLVGESRRYLRTPLRG